MPKKKALSPKMTSHMGRCCHVCRREFVVEYESSSMTSDKVKAMMKAEKALDKVLAGCKHLRYPDEEI